MYTDNTISTFNGPYRFLSNFWPSVVELDFVEYPTVEHAYQAAKTDSKIEREKIRRCETPGQAKRMSKLITVGSDWDSRKLGVMQMLVRLKFQDSHLQKLLLNTSEYKLVEGNLWHDVFWGKCYCSQCNRKGLNHLGKILMQVRELAKNGELK